MYSFIFLPDASIPREMKKPLAWQKREPRRMGPLEKVTIGYSMNQSALNMSLWISNMMRLQGVSILFPQQWVNCAYSCLKLLRILMNQ